MQNKLPPELKDRGLLFYLFWLKILVLLMLYVIRVLVQKIGIMWSQRNINKATPYWQKNLCLWGKIEDVLIKVRNLILSVNFIVLDIEEDWSISVIVGRPFLVMGRTLILMYNGELILKVKDK